MQRVIGVILASFVAILVIGPLFIPLLRRLKFGQPIREDGPQTHLAKQGTPTMGGVMMMLVFGAAAMFFSYRDGRWDVMMPCVLFSLGFSMIGLLDDLLKVVFKNPKGLRGRYKVFLQAGLAIGVAFFCYRHPQIGSKVYLPFTAAEVDLGIWYLPFAAFVAIAMVNSANLTDGLDGLLGGTSLVISATFALIALFALNVLDPVIARNMAVAGAAIAGACLGFLRFNTHPARVFMGDSGSFLLGGALTMVALVMRLPLLLPIACITFVASSVSDIIQIGYFKLSHGKRVFRMAPLHHHFELGGMPETRVVTMYMMTTFIACLVCLWAVSV